MSISLVTGGAGFIGSNLVEALVKRGQRVRVIDNFSTGKRENLKDVWSQIEFREVDLPDEPALRKACEGVDTVFHQAAIPSVPRSVANPITTHRSNTDGTLNLLTAARDARVRRVVYAASSSAYGDTRALPKDEEMLPSPISPYAVQKLASELYMTSFHRVYDLETVSLRYFNIFGPKQDAGRRSVGAPGHHFFLRNLRQPRNDSRRDWDGMPAASTAARLLRLAACSSSEIPGLNLLDVESSTAKSCADMFRG